MSQPRRPTAKPELDPDRALLGVFPHELVAVALRLRAVLRSDPNAAWAQRRLDRIRAFLQECRDEAKGKHADELGELLAQIEARTSRDTLSPEGRTSLRNRISRALRSMRQAFHKPEPEGPEARPSAKLGLVGLALSGGGIRSATFNLGVLQVLVRYGFLRRVDYLSTVSGGGFIGGNLSSLLATCDVNVDADKFPYHHEAGRREPEALRRLRFSGNYLAPGGAVDVVVIPALLLRGIALNLLTIAPLLLLAIAATVFAVGDMLRVMARANASDVWPLFYVGTPLFALLFVLWTALFPVVVAAVEALPDRWARRIKGRRDVRTAYGRSFAVLAILTGLLAVLESLPGLVHWYHQEALKGDIVRTWLTWAVAAAPFVLSLFAGKASANLHHLAGRLVFYAIGALGPILLLLLYLIGTNAIIYGSLGTASAIGMLLGVAAVLVLFTAWFGDVNATSMHGFYRDRLSRAYLFCVDADGQVSEPGNDALRLSELNPPARVAPYHLINATLNLPGDDDPALRGRAADFFIFSRLFVGSERTRYAPTQELEDLDSALDVATAMAISGAAAAPHMGTITYRPLAFILALLNVRLGYWLHNPKLVGTPGVSTLRPRPGPDYFIRELLGTLHAERWFVNVSDGGHIENLGLYQLLRRRCRLIIACDAEADPRCSFAGLAKAIRYALIDLGVFVEFKQGALDEIRKGKSHIAVADITYGPGSDGQPETGHLVYVKASLTGDESPYVADYKIRHREYPHESTVDQFFDEEQFEVYRALGYHVAKRAYREVEQLDIDGDAGQAVR